MVLVVPAPEAARFGPLYWKVVIASMCCIGSPLFSRRRCAILACSMSNGRWQGVLLPGVILPNELESKLLPEVLDNSVAGGISSWRKVFHQSEGIYDAAVEQKPENVSVKLPRLHPHTIVPPKLIAFVHTPHELVINNNIWGAWHCFGLTILLPPLHRGGTCRLAVC